MRAWIPVFAMMLVSLISYIDRNTLAVLSPTILKETGLSNEQYGWIIASFSVAYMIGNPLWGHWLDRLGVRRGMQIAVAIWTVASGWHALLTGFWGFAVARAVLGFGEGATFPGGLRTAMETLPAHQRGRGMAIAYSGGSLGAMVTPLIVTPIAAHWGWRSAFLVTFFVGALWLAFWRALPATYQMPEATLRQLPNQFLPVPAPLSFRLLGEARLWALVCAYGLGAIPLAFVLYAAPLYLGKVLHLTQTQLGYVLWIPPLGWEIGYFFWGWVADRLVKDLSRPTAWMLGLGALSMVLLTASASRESSVVLAALFFSMLVASGFVVLGLRFGATVYPGGQTGLVAGIGAGSWSAIVALYMPRVGRWFDAGRFDDAFVLTGLLPVAGVAGWWLFTRLWFVHRHQSEERNE